MPNTDLPAGPGVAALVAEKVMEWYWRDHLGWLDQYGKVVAGASWCPNTDIAAAWKVLEKFPSAQVMRHEDSEPKERWSCCLGIKMYGDIFSGYASTAPLAICRAALEAVKGNEPMKETRREDLMIDTNRVLFVETATVKIDITAKAVGIQMSAEDSDAQAAILLAWADDVQGWNGKRNRSWPMQCRHITDEMNSVERAHVAAVLRPLMNHLEEKP